MEKKKGIYIVSGLYYSSGNCFELEQLQVECFEKLDIANEKCLEVFKNNAESFVDEPLENYFNKEEYKGFNCSEYKDEDGCIAYSIFDIDDGSRVEVQVNKFTVA